MMIATGQNNSDLKSLKNAKLKLSESLYVILICISTI